MRLHVVNPRDSKHFRDQLFKRFGVLLTASDMWDLRDRIGGAKRLSPAEQFPPHYLMLIQDRLVIVVYDYIKDWYVTAMIPSQELTIKYLVAKELTKPCTKAV